MTRDLGRLTIRAMRHGDIAAGQRLREQAGWNQSDADWQRLLDWEPDGCFVGEVEGQVVASATTTTYGQDLAWIGMVLVDVEHRRQGIGRQLFRHALNYLDERGVRTIGLDATPLGKTLYDQMGFRDAYLLERRRGTIPDLTGTSRLVQPGELARPFQQDDLPALAELDARAFGLDRTRVLQRLAADHPEGCFVVAAGGSALGYLFTRPGARARHIGPLVAVSPAVAQYLMQAALQPHVREEAVMDVVVDNHVPVSIADLLGLAPVRPFIRMLRGPAPGVDLHLLGTSAGPEIG